DADADALLNDNPLALLIGMLLDQQIAIEWAFASPHRLRQRLGRPLTASALAELTEDEVVELFAEKPALHRYPASMAKRAHKLCTHLVQHHDGDPTSVWSSAADARELRRSLLALPGFGKEKTRIFIALLAKRFGIAPPGWQDEAGLFAADGHHSVADLDGPDAVVALRDHRAALKAAGRDKQGR
ncbi:MAG: HhH-GPD-type base excision DNA repair protein, partial [Actinomycetota bacterium]|nr:HhH-GPD-type base excision DNA repair protein [Actinomycetota bacterium]